MPVGSAGYFTNSPSPPTTNHETQPTSTAPHTSTAQSHHQTTSAHDTRQHEPAATTAERHQASAPTDPRTHEASTNQPLGYISQIEQNLVTIVQGFEGAGSGETSALHSKTFPDNSDILVISRNQFDGLNQRLDQLSRRVQSLENSLASDIRLILQLVQGKEPSTAVSGSTSCLTSKPIKEVNQSHSNTLNKQIIIISNCLRWNMKMYSTIHKGRNSTPSRGRCRSRSQFLPPLVPQNILNHCTG